MAAPAAALVFALVLTGCSPDAEPSPMPTPSSPSTSETAEPGPTPPTMPSEAEGTSPDAAKAFVRHYFDQINYAALTGDTDTLRSLGSEECESCDAIASNIERIYNAGGHIAQENWSITSLEVLKSTGESATVSIGARIGREVVVEANGNRQTKRGGKQPLTMFIRHISSGPLVDRLDLVT